MDSEHAALHQLLDGRDPASIREVRITASGGPFRDWSLARIQAATDVSSKAIFFQLEFNGFGQIGSNETVNLFKRNVPGYAVTNPRDLSLVPPGVRQALPFEQVY